MRGRVSCGGDHYRGLLFVSSGLFLLIWESVELKEERNGPPAGYRLGVSDLWDQSHAIKVCR